MRIDHIAFRVPNREIAVRFFCESMGYRIQQEFPVYFNDEKSDVAMCTALQPPEKLDVPVPWMYMVPETGQQYHIPPELFISEGSPGSLVAEWVARHGPGIHHIALQVDDVAATMAKWQAKGWAEFTTDAELHCEGLTQVFTKPSKVCGVVFELIERDKFGFCKENVKALMESTRGN